MIYNDIYIYISTVCVYIYIFALICQLLKVSEIARRRNLPPAQKGGFARRAGWHLALAAGGSLLQAATRGAWLAVPGRP